MTATQPKRSNEDRKPVRLEDIAELVQGKIIGHQHLDITGVAGIQEAQTGDITFLANDRYLPFLSSTQASAVLVSTDFVAPSKCPTLIQTANPSSAFTRVVALFTPPAVKRTPGIHPTAIIHPTAKIAADAAIGPYVVIEADTTIGQGTSIESGVFIGRQTSIGKNCLIYPHVILRECTRIGNDVIIHGGSSIGSDGFGYETVDGKHVKIPQTGAVNIEDHVEIGANVCIDRGRFGDTFIGKGTKIDNLVQIAHNVVIGADCLLVSQTGISGSTRLENGVIVAGQAGLVGHITIGAGAIIGAGAGVTKSVAAKAVVLGSPAKEMETQKKLFALINRLPSLYERVKALEERPGPHA